MKIYIDKPSYGKNIIILNKNTLTQENTKKYIFCLQKMHILIQCKK